MSSKLKIVLVVLACLMVVGCLMLGAGVFKIGSQMERQAEEKADQDQAMQARAKAVQEWADAENERLKNEE